MSVCVGGGETVFLWPRAGWEILTRNSVRLLAFLSQACLALEVALYSKAAIYKVSKGGGVLM